jgi:hypothetical protein
MIKLIVKLALVALLVNAVWHFANVQLSHYRFTDSATEAMMYGRNKSDDELRLKVLQLASMYDVPLGGDDFSLARRDNHVYITGSYKRQVEWIPGYKHPWSFTLNIDAPTMAQGDLSGLGRSP